jgi:hypothetical protein
MRRTIQIQGDARGNVGILAGDNNDNCEKKGFVGTCVLMFRDYRDTATKIARQIR